MEIINVCVDSETWGTDPGSDIRSIGACLFDITAGTIANGPADQSETPDKSLFFYQAVDNPIIPADMTHSVNGEQFYTHWDGMAQAWRKYPLKRDPKTVEWWSKQSAEAQAAFENPVDLRVGLIMFGGWLRGLSGDYYDPNDHDRFYPDDRRLWAHGAAFDPPLLTAAYKALKLAVPYHYRAPRDTRTAFDMAGVTDHSAWLAARPGPLKINHHALDDAICESRGVIDAYARYSPRLAFEAGYKQANEDEQNDGTPYPRWGIEKGFERWQTQS